VWSSGWYTCGMLQAKLNVEENIYVRDEFFRIKQEILNITSNIFFLF
jgi:hypothetical protein